MGLNHRQFERIDPSANTVITMVNGDQYIVVETFDEIVEAIIEFEASVIHGSAASSLGVRRRRPVTPLRATDHLDEED